MKTGVVCTREPVAVAESLKNLLMPAKLVLEKPEPGKYSKEFEALDALGRALQLAKNRVVS